MTETSAKQRNRWTADKNRRVVLEGMQGDVEDSELCPPWEDQPDTVLWLAKAVRC